jgi:tRNA (guanine37-N1)-methyltransferase
MVFHVITVFPELVEAVFSYGVLRRAAAAGVIEYNIVDLRDFTTDKHRSTDDEPFGGGPGMVMLAEPIFKAVESIRNQHGADLPLLLSSPSGEPFSHSLACELAGNGDFILLCGRYEGIDQRVVDHLVNREISIGDYILSGGELAAMVIIDAVARQIPGVIGNQASRHEESFATGLLDWPHYTRPAEFRGLAVPPVLLSGNHAKIFAYRKEAALLLTYHRRPDILSKEQRELAEQIIAAKRREEANHADKDT